MIKYIIKKLCNLWYIIDDYIGWPKMVLIILATTAAIAYGITYKDYILEIVGIYSATIALIFGLYKTMQKDRISGSFTVCVQRTPTPEAIRQQDFCNSTNPPAEILQLHISMNIVNNGHNLVHMGLRDAEIGNDTIQFGILHIGDILIPMQFNLYNGTNFILTKGNNSPYYYDYWCPTQETPPLQNIKVEVFTKTGRSVYLKPQKNTTIIITT